MAAAANRPRGGDDPAPATLIVRVETGFAPELQHFSPVVIERVNAHFGWRCVSRLLFKQGPVPRRPPPGTGPARSTGRRGGGGNVVGGVADEPLRLAFTRLGARVLAGP